MIVCPVCLVRPGRTNQFWVFSCPCGKFGVELICHDIHDSLTVDDFMWTFSPGAFDPVLIKSSLRGLMTLDLRNGVKSMVDPEEAGALVACSIKLAQISHIMDL